MKKRFILTTILIGTIFLTGCVGHGPVEMAGIGFQAFPAVLIFALILIPLFSRINPDKRIYFISAPYLIQLIVLSAFSYVTIPYGTELIKEDTRLMFSQIRYERAGQIENIIENQYLSIIVLPYIIFFTVLFLVIFPKKIVVFLPTAISLLYFLSLFWMRYDKLEIGALSFLNPIFFPILAWYISVPAFIFLLYYLARKRL